MHQPETWLTENDVVAAVSTHLSEAGWEIRQTRSTNQHGIDIVAERNSQTLAIEAKGGGSSKAGSRRYGKKFTKGQKRSHVAMAVLTALREASGGQHKAAIALPNDPEHTQLVEAIWPALRRLNIEIYSVAPDRSVTTRSIPSNAPDG